MTSQERQRARKMWKNGQNTADIARALGIPEHELWNQRPMWREKRNAPVRLAPDPERFMKWLQPTAAIFLQPRLCKVNAFQCGASRFYRATGFNARRGPAVIAARSCRRLSAGGANE